jgi:hypothetical protein
METGMFEILPTIVPLFIGGIFVLVIGTIGYQFINMFFIAPGYEEQYEQILERIKNNPNDGNLRLEARRIGKWLTSHLPQKYTEQSLTNDLIAVIGGHPDGKGVVKVEITNPEKLQPVDVAEQVEKLGQLFLKGVITAEEFERGKALFLGNPPDVARKTMETLDDLYRLQQKGALSEGEYNIKKWDLLSGKLK